MAAQVETTLRSPGSYSLARRVIEAMESAEVWPTPVNFELWLHYLSEPDGALGREMQRLLATQDPFSEATAEVLAAEYLPRGRMSEEIRDAGRVLDRELSSVAEAISEAHSSNVAYSATLAEASANIESADDPEQLKELVTGLAAATQQVQTENASLEQRLDTSTREVARLREHLEQVRRDAMTDALTNLANRKAFDIELESATEASEANGSPLALAVLDIDHFKRFNDTWGHQTGDQVLRYVASVLAKLSAAPRFAARYGGEEFALIFPTEKTAAVMNALECIRKEIRSRALRRRSTNDDLGAVTISIGFAERLPGESASALLERADAALYESKRGGRDKTTRAGGQQQVAA
tara:strand:- start:3280 stop:4338 length:1059 start_codon:yes stop_codon:yes gene_type:complete